MSLLITVVRLSQSNKTSPSSETVDRNMNTRTRAQKYNPRPYLFSQFLCLNDMMWTTDFFNSPSTDRYLLRCNPFLVIVHWQIMSTKSCFCHGQAQTVSISVWTYSDVWWIDLPIDKNSNCSLQNSGVAGRSLGILTCSELENTKSATYQTNKNKTEQSKPVSCKNKIIFFSGCSLIADKDYIAASFVAAGQD